MQELSAGVKKVWSPGRFEQYWNLLLCDPEQLSSGFQIPLFSICKRRWYWYPPLWGKYCSQQGEGTEQQAAWGFCNLFLGTLPLHQSPGATPGWPFLVSCSPLVSCGLGCFYPGLVSCQSPLETMKVEVGQVPRGKEGTVLRRRRQEVRQIRADTHTWACWSLIYLLPLVA